MIKNRTSNQLTHKSIITFTHTLIAQLQLKGRHCTARHYQSMLNSFIRFNQGKDCLLSQIDAHFVQSYEAWLRASSICRNTTSFYMRQLRAVYNRAVDKGLTPQQHPFRHVYTGIDKTRKRAIDLNLIKRLRQLDLTHSPMQSFARDMFIMSFCLRGISFIDLAHLQKTDIRCGYLHYTRSKTHQALRIKWEPIMQQMVDKYHTQVASSAYLFPILSVVPHLCRNAYRNAQTRLTYHLNKIAQTLGIKGGLTLYVARHSWATIARDNQVPLSVISEALGHDSERTTQIYLKSIKSSEVDQANANILAQI